MAVKCVVFTCVRSAMQVSTLHANQQLLFNQPLILPKTRNQTLTLPKKVKYNIQMPA